MIPAFIVLLVLFLLAMIWLGVDVRYADSALTVYAKVLFIKFRVYPAKRRKKKPKQDKKDEKKEDWKEKQKQKHKPKKKLDIRGLIRLGLDAAGKLKRKITVSRLKLHYTAGSKDPGDTAVQYGRVCAAVGVLLPRICQAFRVKGQDVKIGADFDLEKPLAELELGAGMFLWQIVYVGVYALIGFLKLQRSGK